MLEDLPHEWWIDWLNYFNQDPWDEKRKDDRSAVAAIWSVRPYLDDDTEVPGFDGPGYGSGKEEGFEDSLKRLEETKAKYLSGKLNRKTSDPSNG